MDYSRLTGHVLAQAAKIGISLQQQTAADLAALFHPAAYAKGSHIALPGQELNLNMIFVCSGSFRIYSVGDTGKEFNKGFMLARTLTGGLIAGDPDWPQPYGIQALEDSDILAASANQLSGHIAQSESLRALFHALQSELADYKARRAAALQALSAADRYSYFVHEEPLLARQLPAYHIASYLGMSEVTLSRLRNKQTNS